MNPSPKQRRRTQSQQRGISEPKFNNKWVEDPTNPMHSTEYIKCGAEFIEFPTTCSLCDTSLKNAKINLCIFCDPNRAYCEKCGGPASKDKHPHPLMSIIPDFNKYYKLLINNDNSTVGPIDANKEWNKECFSCSKLIKVLLLFYYFRTDLCFNAFKKEMMYLFAMHANIIDQKFQKIKGYQNVFLLSQKTMGIQ